MLSQCRSGSLIIIMSISSWSLPALAGVNILQTEGYDAGDNSYYLPVDFSSGDTQTVVYGTHTVTYQRAAKVAADLSGSSFHAMWVAKQAYTDPAASGYGIVDTVYCQSANLYLNYGLFISSGAHALAPPYLGRTRLLTDGQPDGWNPSLALPLNVVSNAWVGQWPSYELQATRQIDYQLAREQQVVMVNGASTDQPGGQAWSAYNGLTVRGTGPFFPTTATPGKQHTDFWLDTAASWGTGTVAGQAAKIINTAKTQAISNPFFNDAVNNSVVTRSLMMTGANKSGSINGISWQAAPNTGNNLSGSLGAGQPDVDRSLAILNAGERSLASVSGNSITLATPTTSQQGWAFNAGSSADKALVFHAGADIGGVTATLNWNFTQQTTGTTVVNGLSIPTSQWDDTTRLWAHLTFAFVPVTPDGNGGYAIGSAFADQGLSANLLDGGGQIVSDNVEHLYWTSNTSLPAGDYAFLVRGDNSNAAFSSIPLGLSYDVTLVPEPASATLLLGLLPLLSTRRRHAW